jgi:hypothetical protein
MKKLILTMGLLTEIEALGVAQERARHGRDSTR